MTQSRMFIFLGLGLFMLNACKQKVEPVAPTASEPGAKSRATVVGANGEELDPETGLPVSMVEKMTEEQKKTAIENAKLRAQIEEQSKRINEDMVKQNQMIQQQIQMQKMVQETSRPKVAPAVDPTENNVVSETTAE